MINDGLNMVSKLALVDQQKKLTNKKWTNKTNDITGMTSILRIIFVV